MRRITQNAPLVLAGATLAIAAFVPANALARTHPSMHHNYCTTHHHVSQHQMAMHHCMPHHAMSHH